MNRTMIINTRDYNIIQNNVMKIYGEKTFYKKDENGKIREELDNILEDMEKIDGFLQE